ncbi:histidine kinase [Blumeria hordei DH14]|uniref:histidine kinase n=1 Tax=Blumeria graminis f. sp. hordei (strain DH14) TaxID=546991 RepID=N1J706_BLUG1|nr:histidine kinase [Blumeria hordei DH14]
MPSHTLLRKSSVSLSRSQAPRQRSSEKVTLKSPQNGRNNSLLASVRPKRLMSDPSGNNTIAGSSCMETTIPYDTSASSLSHQKISNSKASSGEDLIKSVNHSFSNSSTSTAEIERLRVAMNTKLQLKQRRRKLDRQSIERRSRAKDELSLSNCSRRRSLHLEEMSPPTWQEICPSIKPFNPETLYTESGTLFRQEGMPSVEVTANQSSFPYPTPRANGYSHFGNRLYATPKDHPDLYPIGPLDSLVSGTVTPSSALFLQSAGSNDVEEDSKYATPDIYELSLMLGSEPGLEAWWTTVIEIMRNSYGAQRVTLSVPADSTDIENVPWGQKATFSEANLVGISKKSVPEVRHTPKAVANKPSTRTSEEKASKCDPQPVLSKPNNTRPHLPNRHSFTAYEDSKYELNQPLPTRKATLPAPNIMPKIKYQLNHRADAPPRTGTLQNAQINLQTFKDHFEFNPPQLLEEWDGIEQSSREQTGCMFPVLQALDFEADPLIDNKGVLRVLQRGKVIALTRDYPYVDSSKSEERNSGTGWQCPTSKAPVCEKLKTRTTETGTRFSSLHSHRPSKRSMGSVFNTQACDKGQEQNYDEYEQPPASPWSQSPAPSPAVHVETSENMFFSNIQAVEEESFNPQQTPPDYAEGPQPEIIGADRSSTVLHIPLFHPLLSKPVQSFRLDASALKSRFSGHVKDRASKESTSDSISPSHEKKPRRTPIAILSILTPIIPYPSKLRDSLELLAPHLATTFSLCRHYSNLETEIAGLARKRPSTVGFGAVVPGTILRPVEDSYLLESTQRSSIDDMAQQRSLGGSLTSPSDYSGLSRSNAGSLVGTPVCDSGSNGLQDKRPVSESPSYAGVEGYFSHRARPVLSKVDFGSSVKTRNVSKELSPVGARIQMEIYDADSNHPDQDNEFDNQEQTFRERVLVEPSASSDAESRQGIPKEVLSYTPELMDTNSFGHLSTETILPKGHATRSVLHHACPRTDRPSVSHTLLHSYGADFGATFQPLPSTTRNRAPKIKTHNRSTSIPELTPSEFMPPPSDRVKGILLDSLPLHLFIAVPPTGEIVWVNSRYLSYRGQTVDNLYENPWGSIHPEERKEYLKSWKHALRTGEQFAMQARLRRFDGSYRWFYTRASGLRDGRGVVVQWHGTSMDIHEQHVAEVKAARQEEIEASEAKHRRLANLIPQIIFSATEDDGVTFANQQWLSYTGQSLESSIGFGFMDFVHPDDIAKCQILIKESSDSHELGQKKLTNKTRLLSPVSSDDKSSSDFTEVMTGSTSLSRTSSSSSSSSQESHLSDISGLTQSSAIKVDKDSNGQVFYSTEVRFRSKTGEYRWHLVRCVEVENINLGTGDGSWFGACADINDHKLLEMKLKEAMESKSKFLSNMSHEIRTPLIGISGMISFLQDTVLNEEQMDYCNTISSSAQGLLAIINDILDLAKADAGMMKLAFDWFHVRSLVEEVNETLSTMAITKHLEVNYVVDVDVPEMVKGDRFRIRQALLNVIGNAIKFTSVGEVFTRCKMVSNKDRNQHLGEHEVMLEFSITDTGKGFTQEEAEIIFKPFSQIDSSSTRTQGGTGLGLVISRQLIELHGGKMEGTAVPGKGSTFTFTSVFGLPTSVDYPESPTTPAIENLPYANIPGNYIPLRGATNNSKTSSLNSSTQADTCVHAEQKSNFNAETRSDLSMGSMSNPSTLYASSDYSTKTVTEATSKGKSEASELNKSLLQKVKLSIPVNHSIVQAGTTPPKNIISLPNLHNKLESYQNCETMTKHTCQRMYSILLICPQKYSREATTQHIEMTLSKNVPHKIKALPSVEDAHLLISGEGSIHFTHIVLNLGTADEVVHLIDQILKKSDSQISIVILSDPLQRQEVMKKSNHHNYIQLSQENRITFIFKPVKPSRFAVIFDPDKERDLSTDRNRFSAQQRVATQRQSYLDIGKRLGNKGLRVLLVEDNATNQKVLLKYLGKVGIAVDLALDGLECTEKVFSKPRSYYSLVLCDLHMPNKDGYQACREIREWEKKQNYNSMPIIALSANVMTDVIDRCNKAGFSNYITKPVDFKVLSTIMGDCLDPEGSQTVAADSENEVLRHVSRIAG